MALAQPMRYTMDDLLRVTVERNASDLHLTVGLPPVLRVNGNLVATEFPRLSPEESKRLVYSILNDRQKEKFEKTLELDCSHGVRGFGRFRVNVYRQRGVIGACLRAIANSIQSRQDLHLPPVVEEMVNRPHGLILVTGATGAGKSTTLAAMIGWINADEAYTALKMAGPEFSRKAAIDALNKVTDYTAGGLINPIDWTRQHDFPTQDNPSAHGYKQECNVLVQIKGGAFEVVGDKAKPWNCCSKAGPRARCLICCMAIPSGAIIPKR